MNRKLLAVLFVFCVAAAALRLQRRGESLDAGRFVGGIPALTPDMRLTVARLESTRIAQAESAKVSWGVDWGTTKAVLSAPVRVHYAIDLSGTSPVVFLRDAKSGTVTAVFRDPEVQAVEVFARERRAVVEPGWGRLEVFSGRALVDRLDAGFYDSARADAAAPAALARVRELARPGLSDLVAGFLRRAGVEARVRILFRSERTSASFDDA